jgi:hypothetical protein
MLTMYHFILIWVFCTIYPFTFNLSRWLGRSSYLWMMTPSLNCLNKRHMIHLNINWLINIISNWRILFSLSLRHGLRVRLCKSFTTLRRIEHIFEIFSLLTWLLYILSLIRSWIFRIGNLRIRYISYHSRSISYNHITWIYKKFIFLIDICHHIHSLSFFSLINYLATWNIWTNLTMFFLSMFKVWNHY